MPSRFPVTRRATGNPAKGQRPARTKRPPSQSRRNVAEPLAVGHIVGQHIWSRSYAHTSPARLVEIHGVGADAVDGNDFQCRHAVHEFAGKSNHAACRNCSYLVRNGLEKRVPI